MAAAVQRWREVKAQALEVARVAERLSGQVRKWLWRTMERLAPGQELAHAGGGQGREHRELSGRGSDHSAAQDLAARLRAALEIQRDCAGSELDQARKPDSAKSLAERLRKAAPGINGDGLARRAAGLQQKQLAEERQRALEAERVREQERVRERKQREHDRDRGHDHGL